MARFVNVSRQVSDPLCCPASDINLPHRIQAQTAQSSSLKYTATVDVNERTCPKELYGFVTSPLLRLKKLLGGMAKDKELVWIADCIRFQVVPENFIGLVILQRPDKEMSHGPKRTPSPLPSLPYIKALTAYTPRQFIPVLRQSRGSQPWRFRLRYQTKRLPSLCPPHLVLPFHQTGFVYRTIIR